MQLRRWCNWLVSSFAFVCRNVNCPTICNTALFYEEDGEQRGLQKLLKLLLIVLDYFLNMPTSELSVNFLCRASFFYISAILLYNHGHSRICTLSFYFYDEVAIPASNSCPVLQFCLLFVL